MHCRDYVINGRRSEGSDAAAQARTCLLVAPRLLERRVQCRDYGTRCEQALRASLFESRSDAAAQAPTCLLVAPGSREAKVEVMASAAATARAYMLVAREASYLGGRALGIRWAQRSAQHINSLRGRAGSGT